MYYKYSLYLLHSRVDMELSMQLVVCVFKETWKKTVVLFKPGKSKRSTTGYMIRIYNMNINYMHDHDQG